VQKLSARIGVVTFPGSLDDGDARRAVRLAGAEPVALWHGDADLGRVDAVILPGGFSYGDHLRAGAIASHSPAVRSVVEAARAGTPVFGICNGFQVLCEAGLLPGALTRNLALHFVCRDQVLRVERTDTAWTSSFEPDAQVVVPVKNGEGRYVADDATLDRLEGDGRVVARYVDANPNGSLRDIAGICDERRRVVGLMPHPEHAVERLTGPSEDGLGFFVSAVAGLLETAGAA
jgi:phosphoribosylformylglycinamidine synthase I